MLAAREARQAAERGNRADAFPPAVARRTRSSPATPDERRANLEGRTLLPHPEDATSRALFEQIQGSRPAGDQLPPSWATRPYHAPSASTRHVTGRISQEHLEALGLSQGNALQLLMLDRVLGNRESRAKIPKMHEQIRSLTESRLMGRRSKGRWDDLSSVLKQFVLWNAREGGEDWAAVNVGWKICWFVESKLLSGDVKPPSAYKYVKNLTQSCFEVGWAPDKEVTSAYMASLLNDGALRAEHQAEPATRENVMSAKQHLSENAFMGLWLAWKTASRIGEMAHLTPECFQWLGNLLSITFPYHKGDPHRLGTNIVIEPDPTLTFMLKKRLEWCPSGQRVTELTTAMAAAALAKVRGGLTAHSVKRGSLVTMLRAGVPLNLIQVVAKHKDLETLLIYLPRSEVSLALGLPSATQCL